MKRLCAIFVCLAMVLAAPLWAADYHILLNNAQQGPFSVAQLQQMARDGQFNAQTLAWTPGMEKWTQSGDIAELKTLFVPLPPAPPAAPPVPPPVPPASAPAPASGGDLNQLADANAVNSAADTMEDWFDEVMVQFGLDGFGESGGRFVYGASQSVSIKSTDPQYGIALINAFDKAMMQLQKNYLMARFGRTATEKVRSFYADRSTHADEIPLPEPNSKDFVGKVMKVLDKGLDVAGKKLDQELIEMGVDPQELETMPETKKKDLFRDKFVKQTLRKASGSIAGLFPIQTRVITDTKGNTQVGVIALASRKTFQVAKDIRLQRPSLIKGRARDIKSLLPQRPEAFMGNLGVRLVYDETGAPCILSYGMSSYTPDTGDDYMNDELRNEARGDAVASADAMIAEIIAGRMDAKSDRQRGELVKKYVEREMKPGTDTVERDLKEIIKITTEQAKTSARAKLTGISTIKRWRYTLPSGQKFVGAVRVWKYSTLKAVKAMDRPLPKKKPAKPRQKPQSVTTMDQASKTVNSLDDF